MSVAGLAYRRVGALVAAGRPFVAQRHTLRRRQAK
jgi:hypothetical protein